MKGILPCPLLLTWGRGEGVSTKHTGLYIQHRGSWGSGGLLQAQEDAAWFWANELIWRVQVRSDREGGEEEVEEGEKEAGMCGCVRVCVCGGCWQGYVCSEIF